MADIFFTFQYVSINTGYAHGVKQTDFSFTFQYVSINTRVVILFSVDCAALHSNMFLLILQEQQRHLWWIAFTFQYVSINTNSQQRTFVPLAHLHSNMFLLIPAASHLYSHFTPYLHSNMFLLIRGRPEKENDRTQFTFQYVSINTGIWKHMQMILMNLHSNMFLLIPRMKPLTWWMISVFTFQYVSINTTATWEWYHSTMWIYIPICFY